MKNKKRSLRRYKKWIKFKRRMKYWNVWSSRNKNLPCDPFWPTRKEVFRGEAFTFLRTTNRPCSCYLCSYLKYERPLKQIILKDIFNRIEYD